MLYAGVEKEWLPIMMMIMGFYWEPNIVYNYYRFLEFGNTYRFKQYTSSSASGPTSHLYITAGFATTPPTPMKPEAGLRGRPAAEAPNKKIPHKM
jgi:hypothetical protein